MEYFIDDRFRIVKIVTKSDRIELVIEGLPEFEGKILLKTFMSELQNLAATLVKIDRDNNEGKSTSAFEVASLSFSSPYRVGLEAVANRSNPMAAQLVLQRLDSIASALKTGDGLDDMDTDLLENLQAMAKPVGHSIKNATILFNGSMLEFDSGVNGRLESALAIEDECSGGVAGMLEQINIHHDANVFHIFPDIGPKKITCHFPSQLYDEAVSAVGRRVDVFGILKYRSGASFAHKIAVTSIDVFDNLDDLPDWDDLRGRAPDATGKMSSEAFVRELRDGW